MNASKIAMMTAAVCLLLASGAAAQGHQTLIGPDYDDCRGRAAVVDVRWDLIDTDAKTKLGVKAGFPVNGTWYLNAKPGDLVRAWLFLRSCDGVFGARATLYWYDDLIDLESWSPGEWVEYASQPPHIYSTANGGLEKGGYSRWQLQFDFTHQAPNGKGALAILPGQVFNLGVVIFRVTGSNSDGGLYRVPALALGGYTYDYKIVETSGTLYSNQQDWTGGWLFDPGDFLPDGEFPLFGGGNTVPALRVSQVLETPACPADLNGDRVVGAPDFLLFRKQFGPCP